MEAGSHSINAGASTTSYDAKPGPSAARPSDAHRPEAHSLASPSATAEGSNADPVLSATFIRTCLLITVVWMLISGLLIMISIFVHLGSSAYLFGGSLLSLIGSSLILFTGYLSGPKHRAVFHTIYSLAVAEWINAFRLFFPAAAIIFGMKDDWLETYFDWCYAVAVIGHVAVVASIGYNFVIVLDLNLLIFFPMQYTARHQGGAVPWKAHIAIWLTGAISVLPAALTGNIGLYSTKACYLLGNYTYSFSIFWFAYIVFAVGSVVAISVYVTRRAKENNYSSKPYFKVISQLSYMTLTFFLSWIWTAIFLIYKFLYTTPLANVELFWLGASNVLDAIIWLPFIVNAIKKAKLLVNQKWGNMTASRVPSGDVSLRRSSRLGPQKRHGRSVVNFLRTSVDSDVNFTVELLSVSEISESRNSYHDCDLDGGVILEVDGGRSQKISSSFDAVSAGSRERSTDIILNNPLQRPQSSGAADPSGRFLEKSVVFERSATRNDARSTSLEIPLQLQTGAGDLDDNFADFEAEVTARASAGRGRHSVADGEHGLFSL